MKNRMLLCFVLCILTLGGTAMTHLSCRTFSADDPPVTNPYKGFVCWGENLSDDPAESSDHCFLLPLPLH